jgi:GTP-binding protein
MFVDEVDIIVRAGAGGRGAMSFRREKFVPRGGPDGGNGGAGGSVFLEASPHINTLVNFRFHPEHDAERGKHGSGANKTGGNGHDLVLDVPVGTLVYAQELAADESGSEAPADADAWTLVADLTELGQRTLVARGGKGGLGNAHFVTSTNRAPRKSQPGLPGEGRRLRLHLKLLADVGLVGFPNAGKSTLISRISAARPKIADYPFTTLEPNLGVVGLPGHRSFVVADIPGIIEGAHAGKGLGLRFLQHVERTRLVAVLVPVDAPDPQGTYEMLLREAERYGPALAGKPHVVVLTKADLLAPGAAAPPLTPRDDAPVRVISAVTGLGVPELLETLWRSLRDPVATS